MSRNSLVKKLPVMAALLIAVIVFAGCKKKDEQAAPPPPAVTTAATKPPVQQQASSAKLVPAAGSQLNFATKKDPFKPFVEPKAVKAAGGSFGTKGRLPGSLPIQNYDVTQFKVSGIIIGMKENKALLVDPTGKAYVVKQGMEVGRNDGVITRINPSSIEVVEKLRDDRGKVRNQVIKLSLSKKN